MLCYQAFNLCLVGYSDADWGGDLDQLKSTSGYAFLLNNGAMSWSSQKKSYIALSTMESEYVACLAIVQEVFWLRRLIVEPGIVTHALKPITIHYDSMASLAFSKDPSIMENKHINIRYYFIRDMVAKKKTVNLKHISTSRMVLDPITKPIAFEKLIGLMLGV